LPNEDNVTYNTLPFWESSSEKHVECLLIQTNIAVFEAPDASTKPAESALHFSLYFCKIPFNIMLTFLLMSPKLLFFSFRTKTVCAVLVPLVIVTCPAHRILIVIVLVIFGEEHKSVYETISSSYLLLHPLDINIPLSHPLCSRH